MDYMAKVLHQPPLPQDHVVMRPACTYLKRDEERKREGEEREKERERGGGSAPNFYLNF